MGNAVVDLLFVGISFVVGFADTLGHYLWIAFCVTGIFAIRALHTSRVLEQVTAKSASHNVVELLLDELVALPLMYLLFLLTNSTLSVETQVKWSSLTGLLLKVHGQVNPACRL